MAHNQQILVLSIIAIVFLLIISKCHSYPSYPAFNESPVPSRPTKFHTKNDIDRYLNRMKQYYETMAHLRYWRRDIDESAEDYQETLQNMLREYKNLDYKR